LEKVTGSVRFDVIDGSRTQRWLVTVKKGDIAVSRKNAAADLVVRGERELLERVFSGKENALAAVLRGELTISGASELLVLFQRFLPRPHDARRKGVPAGYARRQQ
jgi:putative sterol carrier protein